jgi:hypothetical protein
LISDAAPWLAMIEDRNLSTHIYDAALADEVIARIRHMYFPAHLERLKKIETV